MADQTARLEAATVRAEVGSSILYRFSNDGVSEDPIPTASGDITNLKKVILDIQTEGANKISFATQIYATTAAGIAATSNGAIFLVRSSDPDEIYAVYSNNAGTAVDTGKRALSAAAVQAATDAASAAAASAQAAATTATARVAGFHSPSATDPTSRDDGSALQIGDTYFNTGAQTNKVFSTSGWVIASVSGVDLSSAIATREPTLPSGSAGQYLDGTKTFQPLNKAAAGLSNVDNTSDLAKPLSTAATTALNLKAPIASPTFTGTVGGITKSMVGLGAVDNTSDSSKPVSTAQQSALNLKTSISDLGNTSDTSKGIILAGGAQFGVQTPGAITAPARGFWIDTSSNGANVWRFRDRMFIGDAAVNDGRQNNAAKDWLETERQYTTNNANLVVLSTIGQGAIVGGSKTSNSLGGAGSMGCIGLQGWAINDNSADVQTAYALYLEARRKPGAGITQGFEIDIVNQGSIVTINPYGMIQPGLTAAAWIAAGGEVSGSSQVSAGMAFINNSSAFEKGIVFQSNSIVGTDGNTGTGVAIEMAKGHVIRWMLSGGLPGANIYSAVSLSASQQTIVFADSGLLYKNTNGVDLFSIVTSSTAVNGIKISPANTGNGPSVQAFGGDANVDIILAAKGSANIHFANLAITGSAGALFGYASFKFNGTIFKIPLYN